MLESNVTFTERITELLKNVTNMDYLVESVLFRLSKQSNIDPKIFVGYNVFDDKLDISSKYDKYVGCLYSSVIITGLDEDDLSEIYNYDDLIIHIKSRIELSLNLDNFLEVMSDVTLQLINDDDELDNNDLIYMLQSGSISSLDINVFDLLESDCISYLKSDQQLVVQYNEIKFSDFLKLTDRVKVINLEKVIMDLNYEKLSNLLYGYGNFNYLVNIIDTVKSFELDKNLKELIILLESNIKNSLKIQKEILKTKNDQFSNYYVIKENIDSFNKKLKFISLIKYV